MEMPLPWLRTLVRCAATAVVAAASFVLLFLDSVGLPNDHYMYLDWAQQLTLGDLPGRDFVDPGMPLQYVIAAIGQWLAPGPLVEVVITTAMMAAAAAMTMLALWWLTGSFAAGLLATALQVVLQPRLYAYPKVLIPAGVALLGTMYARQPSRRRLAILALWIVVAFLLRHDLAVYAGAACVVIVACTHETAARRAAECGRLLAMTIALSTPYLLFVALTEGLVGHVLDGWQFLVGDAHQLRFDWPGAPWPARTPGGLHWDHPQALSYLFYAAYVLPAMAALLAAAGWRSRPLAASAVILGMAVVLALYDLLILRDPLSVRVPDVTAPLTILAAWCVTEAWRLARPAGTLAAAPWRMAAPALASAALAAMMASAAVVGNFEERVEDSGLLDGTARMQRRALAIIESAREWPWHRYWPAGPVPDVITYLNACTQRSDRLFFTWSAPEYYFFARRGFSGGHPMFPQGGSFATPRDRARMLGWLERDVLPIVLVNESRRVELVGLFPDIDDWVRTYYRDTAQITIRDGSVVTIAIRSDLEPIATWGDGEWPCGLRPA
jgi:hypothetical protein